MALLEASKEQKVEIFKEINETTATKLEENKQIIKQWLNTQPHLPHDYDERILASYIRGCKHDLERVKRKLDRYFTGKGLLPEIYSNRDFTLADLRRLTKNMVGVPLPHLRPDGCRVTYYRVEDVDASEIDTKNLVKVFMMIGDIRVIEEGPISGDVFVWDVVHCKPSHISRIFHPSVKKAIMSAQNLPQRLKEIHMVNAAPFVDTAVKFVKMFVKDKIKERFHVHSGVETLFDYIPQEYLPADLGGKEKSVAELSEDWLKKLNNYASYFEKQETVHSDESKRIHNADNIKAYDELYGTVGSFHKLDID